MDNSEYKPFEFNIIMKSSKRSTSVYQYTIDDDFLKEMIEKPKRLKKGKILEVSEDSVPMFRLGYAKGKFEMNQSTLKKIQIRGVSHLILDYDNEGCFPRLIEKFQEQFEDYKYYLYTTKSSTKKINRFRVIFPLGKMYKPIDTNFDYENLMEFFSLRYGSKIIYPDESCFRDTTQYQYLPIFKDIRNYYYHFNEGEILKIEEYPEYNTCNDFQRMEDYDLTKKDEEEKDEVKRGIMALGNLLYRYGLADEYHITPNLHRKYLEYIKEENNCVRTEFPSLYEFANNSLNSGKWKNMPRNKYTVASVLAWCNHKTNNHYPFKKVKKVYKMILKKEMSSDAWDKYMDYSDHLVREEGNKK